MYEKYYYRVEANVPSVSIIAVRQSKSVVKSLIISFA
jgi:hypothetical protein